MSGEADTATTTEPGEVTLLRAAVAKAAAELDRLQAALAVCLEVHGKPPPAPDKRRGGWRRTLKDVQEYAARRLHRHRVMLGRALLAEGLTYGHLKERCGLRTTVFVNVMAKSRDWFVKGGSPYTEGCADRRRWFLTPHGRREVEKAVDEPNEPLPALYGPPVGPTRGLPSRAAAVRGRILRALADGPKRYCELQVLTNTTAGGMLFPIRALVRKGQIVKAEGEKIGREYTPVSSLTDLGRMQLLAESAGANPPAAATGTPEPHGAVGERVDPGASCERPSPGSTDSTGGFE